VGVKINVGIKVITAFALKREGDTALFISEALEVLRRGRINRNAVSNT